MTSKPKRSTRDVAIEHVAPARLVPAPYNPRTMTDEAYTRLRRGIETFGLVDPIVARREDRLVIGGHQRLRAALELGLKRVPVVFLEGLDDQRTATLNVLLNNPDAMGTWDWHKLAELLSELDANGADATLTGFSEDGLRRVLADYEAKRAYDGLGEDEVVLSGESGEDATMVPLTFVLSTEDRQAVVASLRHYAQAHELDTQAAALVAICSAL